MCTSDFTSQRRLSLSSGEASSYCVLDKKFKKVRTFSCCMETCLFELASRFPLGDVKT